jgi:hypothetical protein
MSRGNALEALLRTGVFKYMEFLLLDNTYVAAAPSEASPISAKKDVTPAKAVGTTSAGRAARVDGADGGVVVELRQQWFWRGCRNGRRALLSEQHV